VVLLLPCLGLFLTDYLFTPKVSVGRLNRELVRSLWSSLSLELLFLSNTHAERYSIQVHVVYVLISLLVVAHQGQIIRRKPHTYSFPFLMQLLRDHLYCTVYMVECL
jgi:hypothetical protein